MNEFKLMEHLSSSDLLQKSLLVQLLFRDDDVPHQWNSLWISIFIGSIVGDSVQYRNFRPSLPDSEIGTVDDVEIQLVQAYNRVVAPDRCGDSIVDVDSEDQEVNRLLTLVIFNLRKGENVIPE